MDAPRTSGEPGPGQGQSDALLAVRNALKLGGSLVFTWGIALGVRLLLPRFLGPDAWGPLNFADAFATTFFVALSLGIDTYIRKEVSVRPEHASDFLAGVTTLRLLGTLVLLGVMQVVMVVTHRPPEVRVVVHLFGLANFLMTMNFSFAALLHARGTVDELSVLNIATKLVWGGGTLLSVVLHWPIAGIPAALLASELLKAVVSARLVRRHLGVIWRFDGRAVAAALLGSLPMFLNTAAHTVYNKLDVSILAVVAGDREVAWYGASSLLAGLTLMVAPMIGWVLMPLFARARSRAEEEYTRTLRRSLELVLVVAFPTSLLIALGADLWVALLYGVAYAPAAPSLRILSPLFVLTYVAIISASSLILTGRAWAQAAVSMLGLAVNPLLNWFCIPHGMRWFGEGGAGIGAAWAQLGTEVVVTALMTALVGARAFDRRTLVMIGKTLVVCLAVVLLDGALAPRLAPIARVALDASAYLLLVLAVGAVQVRETVAFARSAFARAPVDALGPLPLPTRTPPLEGSLT